jgi:hypothetical protein
MPIKRPEGKGQDTSRKARQVDPNKMGARVGAP